MGEGQYTKVNEVTGVQFVETRQGRRVVLVKVSGNVRETVGIIATNKTEARTVINALRNMIGDLPDAPVAAQDPTP